MENILGLVVTYKWIFVGIAGFLVLALIGAYADKKQSERFKFAEKKEANLTNEEKSAGETKDVSATANNRAVGTDFAADANKTQTTPTPAPETKADVPKQETPKAENVPAAVESETKKEAPANPAPKAAEAPKA